eukprot:11733-Heterococcus_DN1.PRE.2
MSKPHCAVAAENIRSAQTTTDRSAAFAHTSVGTAIAAVTRCTVKSTYDTHCPALYVVDSNTVVGSNRSYTRSMLVCMCMIYLVHSDSSSTPVPHPVHRGPAPASAPQHY